MNSATLRSLVLLPAVIATAAPYRPASMASVDPDGIRSLLANPAGLALMEGQEATIQLGGRQPAGQDALSVGIGHFGIGWERHEGFHDLPTESNLLLGAGTSLGWGVSVGAVAARHVVDGSVQGWSADLGALWRPFPQISAAWTIPDFLKRDPSRDRTNTVGFGIRPNSTEAFTLSLEAFLSETPWTRASWDSPSWEIGAKIRPLPWLELEGRLDPERTESMGFGARIQATPNIGFFSTASPSTRGSEFQSVGGHFSSRSRASTDVGNGVVVYRMPAASGEGPSGNLLRRSPGFIQVREDFREMSSIAQLKTVVLDLGSIRFPPARAGALRRMILDLKRSGKSVYAWANDLDMTNLHILSAADKAAISPDGAVRAHGLAMDVLYFGGILRKHGVSVQVVKTGPWKAAMEPFEKSSMSDPARENLSRILLDIDSVILGQVAQDRKIDPGALVSFVDTGSLLAPSARSLGLVDTLLDHDDLRKWAKGRILSLPLSGIRDERWGASPRVAVVVLEGQIIDKQGDAGMVPWSKSLIAQAVAARLETLRKDPMVGAVVLRIQSPGGSVVGSERLRRAVEKLAKHKIVVASFAGTAASGAYMLSLPSHRIFAEPEGMVGSIGVFATKVSFGGLLDSLGIRAERVKTAPHAGAMSPYNALDSLETARLTEYVEDAHAKFDAEVVKFRRMDTAALRKVDGGRVFSGVRAKELKLVDTLGGLEDAVRWTEAKTGLRADRSPLWFDAKSGSWIPQRFATLLFQESLAEGALVDGWNFLTEPTRTNVWCQAPWEPKWE